MPISNAYIDFIKIRRSVRKYLSKKVPAKFIDCILKAACMAPSAHNAQPWRFFVLRQRDIKEKLAREMGRRLKLDLIRYGFSEKISFSRAIDSIEKFTKSPIIIVACIDMNMMKTYPDNFRKKAEELMAAQSLAAAIQNILLSASALGLGGCWYSAPLFCPDIVKSVIPMPDHYIPQAFVTLGYPNEAPKAPQRIELNEIRKII